MAKELILMKKKNKYLKSMFLIIMPEDFKAYSKPN